MGKDFYLRYKGRQLKGIGLEGKDIMHDELYYGFILGCLWMINKLLLFY
jgi:hypothetical protein